MRRFLYSILRWPRSHGFGVQSPFAFRFVTEVVRSRKNSVQLPSNFFDNFSTTDKRLLHFYGRLYDFMVHEEVVNRVYVIENIHANAKSYALWKALILSSKVVVSFDLYDCGVLFFDGKMPKFNYKVMLI
jgi:hypothetical protein